MSILIVVNAPERWPLAIAQVQLVAARTYASDPKYADLRGVKLFNLCRSYGYQSLGYYVSLLAEARGHRPQPSVATIQGLKSQALVRIASGDLTDLIHKSLARVRSDGFVLSIYFGRAIAKRHRALALQLFNQFQAPLLRARFRRDPDRGWELTGIRPIPGNEVPESHRPFVVAAAEKYFEGRRFSPRRAKAARYDLAILVDPEEKWPPSNAKALKRFAQAAHAVGLEAETITKDDYGRLAEFDALFIRTTTSVNHYTYRFALRAKAMGIVVIDEPQSIVRAANKVFQAEMLGRHGVPIPRTMIVHKDNVHLVAETLGLPCVLKQPDSAFSKGVQKVTSEDELERALRELLEESELVIAQSFVPTQYDWRVGVMDGKPLYACRYYMAKGHWQIIKHMDGGPDFGKVETIAVEGAPKPIVRAAVRAASLFGDGLYGVDLKQNGSKVYVVEVNDNPSIDGGFEDRVLRGELYRTIMQGILGRIERSKAPRLPGGLR